MRRILFIAVLCLFVASPAMADLFGFSYSNVRTVFDGVDSFSTTDWANTLGSVYRNAPPAGTAYFLPGLWGAGLGSEDFLISMTISDLTATSADGSGSFSITDVDGDTIAGSLSGTWAKAGSSGVFTGGLSNVTYTSVVDDTFDGHLGSSMSMVFAEPELWTGTLVQVTWPGGWFTDASGVPQAFDLKGGSIDAVMPVPGAVLLGMLGLGAVCVKLRKFA